VKVADKEPAGEYEDASGGDVSARFPLETRILSAADDQSLDLAAEWIKNRRLVAFPTDTVYGLGALMTSAPAINQLYIVKGRDATKAIAVLVGDTAALAIVAAEMGQMAEQLALRFWPGPLTIVVTRHPGLPDNLSPSPTIGVRMPNHPVALALLQITGPLAVTSANLSGRANTTTAQEVAEQLGGRIGLILDGGGYKTSGSTPSSGLPSTVVDCTGSVPKILRAGPISSEQIFSAVGL